MFNWLVNVFNKRNSDAGGAAQSALRSSGFQPATLLDSQFIFDLVLEEASRGHFSSDYLLAFAQPGLKYQIQTSITQHQCPTQNGRILKSAIYVFVDANRAVGFSWVVETEKPGEMELYLLAVSSNHRKKGVGRILVTKALSQFPSKTKFVARLYPASQVMLRMLIQMGFKRRTKQGKNTVWLSYVSGQS